MVKQIVIAAGGNGVRLSPISNGSGKPMIEYRGRPLIYYLLNAAKEAGIKEFFISVNDYNVRQISAIAKELEINYELAYTALGFRGVPLLFEDVLDKRFIFACGHHPVPRKHFEQLLNVSESNEVVASSYSEVNSHQEEISIKETEDGFLLADSVNFKQQNCRYIESPHVVTISMAQHMRNNRYNNSWPSLIYRHWSRGGSFTSVSANMPAEFDYAEDLDATIRFLGTQLVA